MAISVNEIRSTIADYAGEHKRIRRRLNDAIERKDRHLLVEMIVLVIKRVYGAQFASIVETILDVVVEWIMNVVRKFRKA